MPRTTRKRKAFSRIGKVYFREWREYRNLTQERAADRIGMSRANLSRIESGVQPADEDIMQRMAEAYRCDPPSLIMRNPRDPEGIWTIWDQIPPERRNEAIGLLQVLARAS